MRALPFWIVLLFYTFTSRDMENILESKKQVGEGK